MQAIFQLTIELPVLALPPNRQRFMDIDGKASLYRLQRAPKIEHVCEQVLSLISSRIPVLCYALHSFKNPRHWRTRRAKILHLVH